MATEEPSTKPFFVYIKGGVFPWTIDDFSQKLFELYEEVEDLGAVSRPIYGLKVIGHLVDGIAKFTQVLPTPARRSYLAFQLDESSRIYVEEVSDGITVMLVSTNDFDTKEIEKVTKDKKPSAHLLLMRDRWNRFAELVSQ